MGPSGYDVWVLKLHENGDVIWQKRFDWGTYDQAYSIPQTSDGGYILSGDSGAYGEAIVAKLSPIGDIMWHRTYGCSNRAYSVQQTSDGGYIATGPTSVLETGIDLWVLKLDRE